jgi:GNAT superfamily N-acetyltransferase
MLAEDAATVAALAGQLGYPATESEIKRRYDFLKDRADTQLLVAQDSDGTVVGWIHVQATYLLESDPRAEIWGLVVEQSMRGSGVGRRLVAAAEDWAIKHGLSAIALRSNTLRVEARKFYEHLGYEVVKTSNVFRKALS